MTELLVYGGVGLFVVVMLMMLLSKPNQKKKQTFSGVADQENAVVHADRLPNGSPAVVVQAPPPNDPKKKTAPDTDQLREMMRIHQEQKRKKRKKRTPGALSTDQLNKMREIAKLERQRRADRIFSTTEGHAKLIEDIIDRKMNEVTKRFRVGSPGVSLTQKELQDMIDVEVRNVMYNDHITHDPSLNQWVVKKQKESSLSPETKKALQKLAGISTGTDSAGPS